MDIFNNKKIRYYAVSYFIGYIISITSTGIPSVAYLSPVKLFAICIMVIFGNAVYYVAEEGLTIVESGIRTIKYCIISIALLFIGALVSNIFNKFNIGLSPFIGI